MKLKLHLLGATLLAGFATGVPAFAQSGTTPLQPASPLTTCTNPGPDGRCDPTASEAESSSEEITVTGSRVRLTNAASQEPIVTVSSQYLETRNITNIADALNEIPGFRGSVTPNAAQGGFGQGVNFINAFGLGSNRSLTLLNGRRVVSSNVTSIFGNAAAGTQVDLNIIPSILVDRIDRVAIGGAPVYGSDAIASTVNVILKDRFNGLELRATSGLTDQGDNARYNISGAFGKDFAGGRGNVTVALSHEQVDGVLSNARSFYRANFGNLNNPTSAQASTFGPAGRSPLNDGRLNPNIGFNNSTSDGFPGSVLVRNVTIPSLSRGGLIVNNSGAALRSLDYNVAFDQSGNLVPYNRGVLFNGGITSTAARASGGDGFTFNDYAQITSDIRRTSANLFTNYDLTEEVTLFAEGLYFHGYGNELVQQPTFNSTLFSGASGALSFSVNNPFLTDQARGVLQSAGYTTFRLSRSNVDLADLTGFSKNNVYRGVFGAKSDFELAGRKYNAEVSVNYGRTDFTDFNQGLNQQNFVNAVNVTRNAAGQIVCTTTPTVNATPGFTPVADAACVPLNLFGEGRLSQEARDYIIQDVTAKSRLQQFVFNASVTGSPFSLAGNDVAFVAGFEHRDERARFSPDAFQVAGSGRSVAILPTSGSYNLDEVFGEVFVPLIQPRNEFFIDRLEVWGRGRYVNNTVNGGFFSWAAGGTIAPIRDIAFRGNFTRSFRAPAITELFAPQTNTFVTVPDLCNAANIGTGPSPATRTRNCQAFLATFPNATPLAASFATVPGRSGGNPVLENEQADSFTFGVALTPRFISGLSITADYIDIKLTRPITTLSVTTIASACFDNESFNTADPANGNQFCSLIRRDAQGQVINDQLNPGVTSTFINGRSITLEAIEGQIDYRTGLSGVNIPGTLTLGGNLFYLKRRIVDTTGVAAARSDGVIGDPQFQGQASIRYNTDTWGFTTYVNYTGEQLFSRFDRGTSPSDFREIDELPDFVTVDASIYYEVNKKFLFTLSVLNLTNRIGYRYFDELIPAGLSDVFGRRYAVSARVRL